MDNPIFAKLATLGFGALDRDNCCGTWKSYAVSLQRFNASTYWIFVAIRIPARSGELRKAIKEALKAGGLKGGAVANVMPNYVQGQLRFSRVENEVGDLMAFLDAVIGVLRANGVGPADTCALSGAPNPDSLCLMRRQDFQGYQPVRAALVQQECYAAREKVEENENNGSYLTGLLGAVVGALLGVGVNLLTMVFLKRMFAILFALVPAAAMFGYKKCRGRTNKLSLVIVVCVSLLCVPLMEYLATAMLVAREYGLSVGETLRDVGKMFFGGDLLSETGPEMLKMLLFMALGLLFGWGYLWGQLNSTKLRGSQLLQESLRPNPIFRSDGEHTSE